MINILTMQLCLPFWGWIVLIIALTVTGKIGKEKHNEMTITVISDRAVKLTTGGNKGGRDE